MDCLIPGFNPPTDLMDLIQKMEADRCVQCIIQKKRKKNNNYVYKW